MIAWLQPVWVPAAAFLLGAVPFSFLIARARGIDIRRVGSGNIGATNLARAGGPLLGLVGLLLDGAKGSAAVALALAAGPGTADGGRQAIAGLLAILGHNFTPFLRFKGGKGVATGAGVFAVLCPRALIVALGVFAILLAVGRMVSLGSVGAAAVLPFAARWTGSATVVVAVAAAVALLTVARHRANLARIARGTEARIGSGGRGANRGSQ
jgi:glycerol-3-phosphate acyltransferase PlsY